MGKVVLQAPESYGLTVDAMRENLVLNLDFIHSQEGIMDEKMLFLERKNVVAAFNLRMGLLERLQAKEAELYQQNKLCSLVKKEVIPFLMSIFEGSDESLMAKMKQCNPDNYAILLQEYTRWEDILKAKLQPDEKFTIALRIFNGCLEETGAMVIRIHDYWKGNADTLAIARVHEREEWPISDASSILFYELEVLFPLLHSSCLGAFDRNLGSWVDLTSAFRKAIEYFAQREGRIWYPSLELGAQYSSHYETAEALGQALAHQAFFEEVKHQVNFYYQGVVSGGEDEHHNRIQFLRERLLSTSNFIVPPEWTPIDVQLQFARNIEELNVKLTAMAFSPDPHLELVLYDNTFQIELQFCNSSLLYEGAIIAALLMDVDATVLGSNALRDIISWDSKTLRKAALAALRKTFREDFENLPFCGLDENGNLVATPRTHPFFYQWQQ